jgi:hypothetical protein
MSARSRTRRRLRRRCIGPVQGCKEPPTHADVMFGAGSELARSVNSIAPRDWAPPLGPPRSTVGIGTYGSGIVEPSVVQFSGASCSPVYFVNTGPIEKAPCLLLGGEHPRLVNQDQRELQEAK